jgi:hypothetical protein
MARIPVIVFTGMDGADGILDGACVIRNRAQATRELVSMTLRLGLGSVLEPPTMEERAKGGKGRPASNPGAGSRSDPQFTAH